MAHRIVEILIGRLITDERFRGEFLDDPRGTLVRLGAAGVDLTATEVAALLDTDPGLWTAIAERVDPRLQKVSLGSTTVERANNP